MNDFMTTAATSLGLIIVTEMGDKTQLVCMTLAARHRALPVWLGTMAAFAVLNLLTVLGSALVARWVPAWAVSAAVAILFAVFAYRLLRPTDAEDATVEAPEPRRVFWSTALLIFLAEFGDKTQLAVAGLASTHSPWAVWVGTLLGLMLTTTVAVVASQTLLRRLPVLSLQRLSAAYFSLLVVGAAWHTLAVLR